MGLMAILFPALVMVYHSHRGGEDGRPERMEIPITVKGCGE